MKSLHELIARCLEHRIAEAQWLGTPAAGPSDEARFSPVPLAVERTEDLG
jgi:hypothetical protein